MRLKRWPVMCAIMLLSQDLREFLQIINLSPEEAEDQSRNHGRKCPNCGEIACTICAHEAAAKAGKTHFICPNCGEDLRGHDL